MLVKQSIGKENCLISYIITRTLAKNQQNLAKLPPNYKKLANYNLSWPSSRD